MLSRLKFPLVCAFRGVGCVLVWVRVALRLVGRLFGFVALVRGVRGA